MRVAPADGIDFPGAAQILRTVRYRSPTHGPRTSKEITFAITSLPPDQTGPEQLAHAQQHHWSRETRHRILDVTFGEDACRARTGHAAQNLSTLRDLAISAHKTAGHANHAAARRHHTHSPEEVLALYEL